MNIKFYTKELEKMANDRHFCYKKLGVEMGKVFLNRLAQLLAADSLEDIKKQPGRYHGLVGNRKGQWACDLR